VPIYVNRRTRVRHVDPECSALRLSKVYLDEEYVDEPEQRPKARVVELPDPQNPAEIETLRDFTYPCQRCVPGARESWKSFPIDFEDPYEDEE
jgi:hypothetical protein